MLATSHVSVATSYTCPCLVLTRENYIGIVTGNAIYSIVCQSRYEDAIVNGPCLNNKNTQLDRPNNSNNTS